VEVARATAKMSVKAEKLAEKAEVVVKAAEKATLKAEKVARRLAAPKIKGVTWHEGGYWEVVYWFNGSPRRLGYYGDHRGAAAVHSRYASMLS
jgi:hypothetical protein